MKKELEYLIKNWRKEAAKEKLKMKECKHKEGKYIHSGEYRRILKMVKDVENLLNGSISSDCGSKRIEP